MHCSAKSRKIPVRIILAILMCFTLFCVSAQAAQVPGDGNAVDGTIRDVAADQIAKGAQITTAPSIFDTSHTPGDGQITSVHVSSSAPLKTSTTTDSPVLVCGSGKASISHTSQPMEYIPRKGSSLGMFVTTGYCLCEECSGGFGLTYSGTVPQARHTISADISLFPIGTRLMIDDIIYTVEDIGSNVTGDHIDIYYDNHEEAMAHGKQTEEVFTVE